MARTFILARHGESTWNVDRIYQGRLESELSTLGVRQAEALAERLSSRHLAAVYTSPLRRAVRTAELVLAKHTVSPTLRAELIDVDHGQWSGLPEREVERRWPELYRRWRDRPAEVRFPEGESLMEVRDRALGFLAFARHEHAEGTILVVTHGEVLQLLLANFLEMKPEQLWTLPREHCAISIIDDYDVPLVMAINDTCHLDGVRSSLHVR